MADDFEIKLEAYIDGVLPPHERAELESQLMTSPRHRRIVDQLMHTRHLINTLPRVQAPPDLLESIDPSVERAALFDEPVGSRRMLISPQVLALAATIALAATLITAMWLLVPANDNVAVVEQPLSDEGTGTGDPVAESRQNTADAAEPTGDGVEPEPTRVADGGDEMPDRQEPEAVADRGGSDAVAPVIPQLPDHLADSMLISATVDDIAQASGTVSEFLTTAEVPIEAQRLPAASLPQAVRERLMLAGDAMVQVFTVGELSLQQVGALTTELATGGTASALAPSSLVAEHRPNVPQTQEAEQNQNIYQDDQLEVLIQRKDDPVAEPPAGMPALDKVTLVEVQVTSDGYADFGKIGLGRIDVLGKQPAEVAALVGGGLRASYQIEAEVEVTVASGGMPQAGRNREAVRLVYLDREPLKPGELVQIELPDGAWLHAVVEENGSIHAGDYGHVEAAGRSATEVQQSLHEIAVQRAAREAEQNGQVPLTTARSPKPMRVVNLSGRRAAGVDSFAGEKVPCLIVLAPVGAAPGVPEVAPVPQPAPAETGPDGSQPPAQPATIDPTASRERALPPKRRPNR